MSQPQSRGSVGGDDPTSIQGTTVQNAAAYVASGWFHESVTNSWAIALYNSSLETGVRVDMETIYQEIEENISCSKRMPLSQDIDQERIEWARRTASRALRELAARRLYDAPLA
jgi:hypothetical protein